MAVHIVRVMCFFVLVAWNSGHSFVLKSMVAPSFLTGNGFPAPPKLNGPNPKATGQRVNALEEKIEDLLHDNDKRELRLDLLETAIESKSPYVEATDKRVKNLEKKIEQNGPNLKATDQRVNALEEKIEDLLHASDKRELRLVQLETAIESKSPYVEATDKRVKNLEKKIEKMSPFVEATDKRVDDLVVILGNVSRGNERREVHLGNLERAITKMSRDKERKEVRLGRLETAIKKKSPYAEAINKRLGNLENTVAVLKSSVNKDCGSPPPVHGADVFYNSSRVYASAVYRCKKGLLHVNPDGKRESACQESELWTPVDIKCANISRCSLLSGGKVFYAGTEYETLSGQTCQRWDSQAPHTHSYKDDHYFSVPGIPQNASGSANYCRDPAGDGYLWCYTTELTIRWEKCYVPEC
ncbi:chromosome partition protein Smc-like [Haliotis asinina]|uniref:chromosome partition protein Smc-like n=1 Tax=Haliotis asinina TaxID=109174 RepID=UPI0035321463